jgi:hypothetical protein
MLCNPDVVELILSDLSTALPLDKSMPSIKFASMPLQTIVLILGFLCMTQSESPFPQMLSRSFKRQCPSEQSQGEENEIRYLSSYHNSLHARCENPSFEL